MDHFIILETTGGFEVTRFMEGETALEVAKNRGGILLDEGPYPTFEAAIREAWQQDPRVGPINPEIDVVVGTVTLRGEVRSLAEK